MLRFLARSVSWIAACLWPLLPASLSAQSAAGAPALAPPKVLAAFDVAAATLQNLALVSTPAPGGLTVDLWLGGSTVTVVLAPFDVRPPGFRMFERTAGGLVLVPTPPCRTFRGSIVHENGSAVAATVEAGQLTAYVRRANGDVWVAQPLALAFPGAAPGLHVVFRGADGLPLPASCAVLGTGLPLPPAAAGLDVVYACELAIEADHPLFLANGSSTAATQADVLGVVNAIDLIFRNDVQIQLQVTQLIVDVVPDPYTTSVASALLAEFQTHWNTNYAALARDTAHLFSGRPLGASSGGTIGFANVGVVCNLTQAYGVSQTNWTTNFAYRVGITAHELGHNCNATHCDGQPTCSLMCSLIGGCSGNVGGFGAAEQAQIQAFQQFATCLAPQATQPQITGVTPVQIATVNPPLVTITGSGFVGTTAVTVAGQAVTNGIQVLSDSQLRFVPPAGLPLAFHPVSVTNAAGTSNAAVLWYRGSDPCQVLVPSTVSGGAVLTWTMGGLPGDDGYLIVALTNTTSPLYGQLVLDGFLLLWSGALDARGMATLAVPIPPGFLAGITLYSQMGDALPGAGTLRSVSATPATAFQ